MLVLSMWLPHPMCSLGTESTSIKRGLLGQHFWLWLVEAMGKNNQRQCIKAKHALWGAGCSTDLLSAKHVQCSSATLCLALTHCLAYLWGGHTVAWQTDKIFQTRLELKCLLPWVAKSSKLNGSEWLGDEGNCRTQKLVQKSGPRGEQAIATMKWTQLTPPWTGWRWTSWARLR